MRHLWQAARMDRSQPTAPTLSDGVVTLRSPGGPGDVQGSWEQSQDPESIRWTTVPTPYSHTDAVEFLDYLRTAWQEGTEWGFVVEYDGAYAGSVSLRPEKPGRAEVGYGAHPRVRRVRVDGISVMERALRLLLDWGFAERDLQTVAWYAHVGNWPSRRLAWKLGFTVEGTLRRFVPQRGELRDAWVGTLLRDDPREPRTSWLAAPVLEDDSVRLRPHHERDLTRMAQTGSDPATQRWLSYLPRDYGEEHAAALLGAGREDRATGVALRLALADPATDAFLGNISLFDIRPGRQAELAFWLHPEGRGRGLAVRAGRLMLGYAFGPLGLPRVTARATAGNTASIRTLERLGMHRTGLGRRAARTGDGGIDDFVTFDLLSGELGAPARSR